MKNMNSKYSLFIVICCFLCQGCNILNVDEPNNKIIGADLFKDNESARSAVLGIYSAISGTLNLLSGSTTIYTGMYADELTYTGTGTNMIEFYQGTLSPDNLILDSNFWTTAYLFIYQVNACLEGLEKSKSLTTSVKEQLTGECLFLRALLYFYMIQLFGDVPLVTVTDYRVNEKMPRTDIKIIEEKILADLLQARELLSVDYPSTEKVRASRWVAVALLARVYLQQKNWINAEREASEIINTKLYYLEKLNNVFLANSPEAIFQFKPVLPGYNTLEANTLIPTGTTRPQLAITTSLLGAFEPNDKRRDAWIRSQTVNGIKYYYPFKYKQRPDFSASFKLTEYCTVFRFAEMYLIRAESRAALGLLPEAIKDLDSVRLRAGLPSIAITNPGISDTDLLRKIRQERRTELFAERGHRWFDLKRTDSVNATMIPLKPGWLERNHVWPVPRTQITLNPFLIQNNGYN